MASSSTHADGETPPPKTYFNMKIRYVGQDKKLMSNQFDLEAFSRRQEVTNRKIEESLALLIDASLGNRPTAPTAPPPPTRGWKLPPSLVQPPTGVKTKPIVKVKPEAPRFNGENATDWIRKIQRYFNHLFTPLQDWIYLTAYLFDHPASSWLPYWEDNCMNKSWDQFLLAVKHRFDPDLYIDHMGCLAGLKRTTTVEAY